MDIMTATCTHEPAPYHTFKTVLGILAVNCAGALVVPIFFSLLWEQPAGIFFFGRVFVMAIIYANAIGFLANGIIPRLYPGLAAKGPALEWATLISALV